MNVPNPAVAALAFVPLLAVSMRATAKPAYDPLATLGCALYATHHGCAVLRHGPGVILKRTSTSTFWSALHERATETVEEAPMRGCARAGAGRLSPGSIC